MGDSAKKNEHYHQPMIIVGMNRTPLHYSDLCLTAEILRRLGLCSLCIKAGRAGVGMGAIKNFMVRFGHLLNGSKMKKN